MLNLKYITLSALINTIKNVIKNSNILDITSIYFPFFLFLYSDKDGSNTIPHIIFPSLSIVSLTFFPLILTFISYPSGIEPGNILNCNFNSSHLLSISRSSLLLSSINIPVVEISCDIPSTDTISFFIFPFIFTLHFIS